MELVEKLPIVKIQFLNSLTMENFSKLITAKTKDELKQKYNLIKHFCEVNIKDRCQTTRIYSYSLSTPLGSGGRLYSGNSVQSLPTNIRGFLMDGITTDIDMKNAHPTILRYICKSHDILCPFLNEYIEKRDIILNSFDGYTKDEVKELFLISMNDNKSKRLKTGVKNNFFKQFDKEMKQLQIIIGNLECYKEIKSSVPSDKHYNWNGSTMNRVMCMYENKILHSCISVLNRQSIEIAVLMFDGIMVYGNHYDNDDLLKSITNEVNNEFEGLNLMWSYKHHNSDIIIPDDFQPKEQVIVNSFEKLSDEFEKTHCKIINKSVFIKELENDNVVMSKYQITTSYEHLTYNKINESGETLTLSFIQGWLHLNPKQRCFDDIGIYPNPDKCPKNHFNLWRKFAMEYVTTYESKPDELLVIRNHLKILCGNDEIVADYFEKWIAQLIQHPDVKSICPTFISKQGAGKGTLMKLLGKMLGDRKVFETTTPSRDVWGDFNGVMANAYIVNLNELSKKETLDSEGKMKGLITDSTLYINNKGVNQFPITSYHRFIGTTNSEEPFNTSKDDRRNIMIRSSDEKCGDKEYFNKLHEILEDVNVIKTCYEYFKSIQGVDKFNSIPIPTTKHQSNLKELSLNPIEQWLEHFTMKNNDKTEVELLGVEACSLFLDWCESNFKEYKIDAKKFGVRLSNLNISGVKKGRHTNKGDTKIYDIVKLKEHFKIGCLIDYAVKGELDVSDV